MSAGLYHSAGVFSGTKYTKEQKKALHFLLHMMIEGVAFSKAPAREVDAFIPEIIANMFKTIDVKKVSELAKIANAKVVKDDIYLTRAQLLIFTLIREPQSSGSL